LLESTLYYKVNIIDVLCQVDIKWDSMLTTGNFKYLTVENMRNARYIWEIQSNNNNQFHDC